jgi:hypothetical protein
VEPHFYRGICDFHRVFAWCFAGEFVVIDVRSLVLRSTFCGVENFPRF